MKIVEYKLTWDESPLRAALVADFHNGDPEPLIDALRDAHPDVILVAGDVVTDARRVKNGLALLRAATTVAPTFFSLGNHEAKCGEDVKEQIAATGVRLLDDEYTRFGGIFIGGLSTGWSRDNQRRTKQTPPPALGWLDGFCAEKGVKVLLCHHPEYYPAYLSERSLDLVLAGHAHGGQWRLFGRGLFAPGQGIFPKFTSGAYRGRKKLKGALRLGGQPVLIVSRGLHDHTRIPRINNPQELIVLDFQKDNGTKRQW